MTLTITTEDSVQKNALKVSIVGTVILWIILSVTVVVMPDFSKKDDSSVIQIILDPPPVPLTEKENETIEKPLPPQKSEQTETKAEKLPPSQKSESKPVEPTPPKPAEKAPESQKMTKPETKPQQTTKQETKPQTPPKTQEKPASAPAPKPVPAPSEKQSTSVQQPSVTQKTTTTETQSSAPKKANITYKQSVDDLMAMQQNGSTKKKLDWDDIDFGDDNEAKSSNSQSAVPQQPAQKAISGAAAFEGTSAFSSGGAEKAIAKADNSGSTSAAASSATSDALSKIAKPQVYTNNFSSDYKAVSTVEQSTTSDGKVSMKMSDGSARILIKPAKPSIILSPDTAALIDSQRMVKISFKVTPGGNVPITEITFTPSSLLPLPIQSEIREQISKWVFQSGATETQAQFEYSIIKR